MHQEFDQNILCTICSDVILTPARLACKHEFCCYCIRSIKYNQNTETIHCPLCRREELPAGMDKERGIEVINHILVSKMDMRIFHGQATTINHYDKNETYSQKFFLLLKEDKLHGDIIWGRGTEHSSYLQEVGRLQGKVNIKTNGDIELSEMRCYYSNSPYQIWKGVFQSKGNKRFEAESCIYQWFGWGRESSGDLIVDLLELEQGKTLSGQGIL